MHKYLFFLSKNLFFLGASLLFFNCNGRDELKIAVVSVVVQLPYKNVENSTHPAIGVYLKITNPSERDKLFHTENSCSDGMNYLCLENDSHDFKARLISKQCRQIVVKANSTVIPLLLADRIELTKQYHYDSLSYDKIKALETRGTLSYSPHFSKLNLIEQNDSQQPHISYAFTD